MQSTAVSNRMEDATNIVNQAGRAVIDYQCGEIGREKRHCRNSSRSQGVPRVEDSRDEADPHVQKN